MCVKEMLRVIGEHSGEPAGQVLSFPVHEFQLSDPSMWTSPMTWLNPIPHPGMMGMGSRLWLMRLKFPFTCPYARQKDTG